MFSSNTIKILAAGVVLMVVFLSQNFISGQLSKKSITEESNQSSTVIPRNLKPPFFTSKNNFISGNDFDLPQAPLEQKISENSGVSAGLPENDKTVLSREQIFKLQHPESYLEYLSKVQDAMIAEDFLSPGEKQSVFNSEDEVLSFWRDTAFDYLTAINVVSPDDKPRFLSGLALVKDLHQKEAKLFWGQSRQIEAKEFLAKIIKKFFALFGVPALAQPICFKEGVSAPATPGVNLIAPCCNCVTPIGNPIGCLNAFCVHGSAIYDQTTFICGCG